MSFLSDFLIGTNTSQANAPATAMTEVEWYRQLAQNKIGPYFTTPRAPGYLAPPQVTIEVPNSANEGPLASGSSAYPSIESVLQQYTQVLVGVFSSSPVSDTQVMLVLSGAATSAAAWLGGLDPAANNIPALVQKYFQVYKTAITAV